MLEGSAGLVLGYVMLEPSPPGLLLVHVYAYPRGRSRDRDSGMLPPHMLSPRTASADGSSASASACVYGAQPALL